MAQSRSKRIAVYIEPIVYTAFEKLTGREDETLSTYIRRLIIEDLQKRELVTDQMLHDVLV